MQQTKELKTSNCHVAFAINHSVVGFTLQLSMCCWYVANCLHVLMAYFNYKFSEFKYLHFYPLLFPSRTINRNNKKKNAVYKLIAFARNI